MDLLVWYSGPTRDYFKKMVFHTRWKEIFECESLIFLDPTGTICKNCDSGPPVEYRTCDPVDQIVLQSLQKVAGTPRKIALPSRDCGKQNIIARFMARPSISMLFSINNVFCLALGRIAQTSEWYQHWKGARRGVLNLIEKGRCPNIFCNHGSCFFLNWSRLSLKTKFISSNLEHHFMSSNINAKDACLTYFSKSYQKAARGTSS